MQKGFIQIPIILGILGVISLGTIAYNSFPKIQETLNLGASVFKTIQGGTGTSSPSGILYGDNNATQSLKTVTIGTGLDLTGTTLSATGGGGGADFPNVQAWGNSTSTTLGFLNGFLSTASSTISSSLRLSSLSQGVSYIGSTGLINTTATGTITCTGDGVSCVTTGLSVIGGNLTITGSDTNASSTLLSDTNSWTGVNRFGNASSTYHSFGTASTTNLNIGGQSYISLDGTGLSVSGNILNCDTASGSTFGCLTSTDWTTFNNSIDGSGGATQVAFFNGVSGITSDSAFTFVSGDLTVGQIFTQKIFGGGGGSNEGQIDLSADGLALTGSNGSEEENGRNISLTAGDGGSTSGNGGNINLTAGTALGSGINGIINLLSNASSTLFSTHYASSTQYFGANLQACDPTTGKLTWTSGVFGCGTDFNTGGASFGQAWEIGGNGFAGFLAPTTTQKVWVGQASSTILSAHKLSVGQTSTTTIDHQGNVVFASTTDWTAINAPATPTSGVRMWAQTDFGKTRLHLKNADGIEFVPTRDGAFIARNSTGSTITKGSAVYINGALGNSRPTVALADADSEATTPAVGLAFEDISNNGDGYIITSGIIDGIATSGIGAEGERAFLSQTAGELTGTRPSMPAFTQLLGVVLTSHGSNGKLYVNVPSIVRFGAPTSGSILFGNGDGLLTQDNASLFFDDTRNALGVATNTPYYQLTIASTTGAQLALSHGVGINQWVFRNAGGSLYVATSTHTATSTTAAITINSDNVVRFGNNNATCIALTGSADLCDGNDGGGAGGADGYGFILDSFSGTNNVHSTTSPLWLKATSPWSMIASTTFSTYASTTQLTVGSFGNNRGIYFTDDDDGALTIQGIGNSANESLTLNFDDTANSVVWSSATGVNTLDLSAFTITPFRISMSNGDNLISSGQNLDLNAYAVGGAVRINEDSATNPFKVYSSAEFLDSLTAVNWSGFGTTTPRWALQISSSTKPQLALSDSSLTSPHWTFRNAGGNLYIATSSPTTFATTTPAALTLNNSGLGLGIATSTFSSQILGLGTSGSTNGTSTIAAGKIQIDGYNAAGTRVCMYIVGTALQIDSGACNQ